jgi:capsular exopolysaccharide synthesis family protein
MQPANGDQPTIKSPEVSNRELILGNGLGGPDSAEMRSHAAAPSLSMTGMLKALQRHWLLASSLGLLSAAFCAAATWYFLPPGKYTAQVKLHVDSVPRDLLYHDVHIHTDFAAYQRTQIALVKTRKVLETALLTNEVSQLTSVRNVREKRGLDEAINWLERELVVDFAVGPEILRIALSGDRAEELKTLVTAVKEAYLGLIVKNDYEAVAQQLKYLQSVQERYDGKVKRIRTLIDVKAKKPGTTDPNTLALIRRLDQEYLNHTKTELVEIRSDLRRAMLDKEVAASGTEPEPRETTVDARTLNEFLSTDPEGRKILERKEKLTAKILEESRVFVDGDSNPHVRKYKQELEAAGAELEKMRKDFRSRLAKEFVEKGRIEKLTDQARLDRMIDRLQKYEVKLTNEIKNDEKKNEENGVSSLEIESLKGELLLAEDLAKTAANRLEALNVERLAPKRISALEEAYVTHPDEQKRKLAASAAAGGGALALVLFGIAWFEFRRQRVNSVDEVIQGLGMKLMGTVPALPSRRQLRLMSSNDRGNVRWQNVLTESVDTARTMLLRRAASESLQMIMVTSAVGGEGKTSLSSHLAASLARAGRKTLLLDADLRNPAIHRLFGMDRSPGLCELLRGEIDVADAIQPTPASGLSLIPAGHCDELALQALAQDSFQKICEPLRAEFDFIVVDSAPVLPVADSLLVGQYVDGVIFSILYDVSRFPKVYAAHQRLEMLGIRMLGAVVSGAKVDDYGPDYQYGPEVHA